MVDRGPKTGKMRGMPSLVLLLAGAALILALAAWVLSHPWEGTVVQAGRLAPGAPSAPASDPTAPPGQVLTQGPDQPVARDTGADSIADILEPQAGQLEDVLAQLRAVCPAARSLRGGGDVPLGAATRCVEAAEAAMGTVDLIRGTVASPAGAGMPGEVRKRWDSTLDEAVTTIRAELTPLWDVVGRSLASGLETPERLRALGHLRDRMGEILSQAAHP